MSTYTKVGCSIAKLNNIPRNIKVGYGNWASGKVHMKNNSFLMYGSISLNLEGSERVNPETELLVASSITLSEVPCDANGNILLTSQWLSHQKNLQWLSSEQLTAFFLCSAEPTHRINLLTGTIIANDSDDDYLKDIIFNMTIAKR